MGETRQRSEGEDGGKAAKADGKHPRQKGREDQEKSQEDDEERQTRPRTQCPRGVMMMMWNIGRFWGRVGVI